MIGDPKYFGTNENKEAFKIIISYSFLILKYKQVLAGAKISNIASNFLNTAGTIALPNAEV